MNQISENETLAQSLNAFKQWGDKWKRHATENGKYCTKSLKELDSVGKDKTLVCVAFGNSLEKKMESLKNLNLDIFCCDKAFKTLVQSGIYPSYCLVEDANVSYEKYCDGVDSSKTTLIANVTSNPLWIKNWKGKIYFHVNKDNIKTEQIFTKLSGCRDIIYAASNVSNTQVVIATSIMKYSKILLVGYDYSWKLGSNYYGSEDNEKKFSLNHLRMLDINNDMISTSNNLYFSARWLESFCEKFNLPVYNCSETGILYSIKQDRLERYIKKEVN